MGIDEKKLGLVVKEVRQGLGITQHELSRKTDLTINYISRFENGHRGISIQGLNSVAKALGVPVLLLTTMATNVARSPRNDAQRLLKKIQTLTRQAIALYVSAD